jgi:hypothetical protein
LRLCEKIISFFGDQTLCPLAGGLADTRHLTVTDTRQKG